MSTVSFTVSADLGEELRERLAQGVVTFIYKKQSTGEPRLAHGTTCRDLFSYDFKGDPCRDSSRINYFDLDRGGWRCCNVGNIVGIIE